MGRYVFGRLMSVTSPADEQMPPEPSAASATAASDLESVNTSPGFGWTQYAELLNGRFAMIGFAALLAVEFFTRQDFFTWIGLR